MGPAPIGIIGLGYVGLPLAVAFAEAGQHVIGVDVDAARVARLAAGSSDIEDIPDERLKAVADRLEFTTRYAELARAQAIAIAVPTPLTPQREPDLGAVMASAAALAGVLQHGQLIGLETTT